MPSKPKTPPTEAKIVHNKDGSVTVHQPEGKHHSQAVTVLLSSDDALRNQVGGFANFLRDYAVVGLAVGFIVGQQANAVVKQLVATTVDPLAQMWFGHNLSGRTSTIHHGHDPIHVPWGAFVYALLDFFLVLAFIYLIIKLFKLDKLKKVESKK